MMRAISSIILGLVLSVGTATSPAGADGLPPLTLGNAHVHNIKDKAVIRMSQYGYVYISGKHDSRLTITYLEGANSLRYRDTGTKRFSSFPKSCHREKAQRGIAAVCKIPARFSSKKMFVQVWPRLGNDYVDGRTLPSRFRLWVLTDDGRDVVYGGSGADFVNGAMGNDRAYGGAGNDWLRGGHGADTLVGGAGRDRIAHN